MPRLILLLLALLFLVGCKPSPRGTAPPSTDTKSDSIPTLTERINFLQKYVTFRRSYESLDFHVVYHNQSNDMLPAPNEWNIRLIAVVPESEIAQWIPANVVASKIPPDTSWLKSIPTSLDLSGITEWYEDTGRTIGIDRVKRIIAYRAQKF